MPGNMVGVGTAIPGATVTYTRRDDNTLDATYEDAAGNRYATLRRIR